MGSSTSGIDERFMGEALALARRGTGRVSPNPLVGAVLVREGRVVGRGYHAVLGGPHAEAAALADAGGMARGADLYVSLEPCNHHGKTPPCSEAILRAGVKRVFCAMPDPNPNVTGGGAERLRAEGVEVRMGLMEEEARALNAAYLKHVTTGLPLVELKAAVSLDGRIAAAGGRSRWITGPEARALVHTWRAAASAVLTGAGTVRADDPSLTVRDAVGPNPKRIVATSKLDVPLERRVFGDGEAETIAATTTAAPQAAENALAARGVRVWRFEPDEAGRVPLDELLARCGAEGMNHILVEGGAALSTAVLRGGYADRLHVFVAPVVMGGDGIAWAGPLGVIDPAGALRLGAVSVARYGDDVLISGEPSMPAAAPVRAEKAAAMRDTRGPGAAGRK